MLSPKPVPISYCNLSSVLGHQTISKIVVCVLGHMVSRQRVPPGTQNLTRAFDTLKYIHCIPVTGVTKVVRARRECSQQVRKPIAQGGLYLLATRLFCGFGVGALNHKPLTHTLQLARGYLALGL